MPHPDLETLRNAAADVMDWSLTDFAQLPERGIGRVPQPTELAQSFDNEPPEQGRPFADILQQFQNTIVPNTMRLQHPRFVGFIPSAPTFPAVLAEWLTASLNSMAGVWLEGAAAAHLESIVLGWIRDWLELPAEAGGLLTSGGSEANLTALVTARERHPAALWPRLRLYASDQRHWSIDRAMKVIGLRPEQLVSIRADLTFRLAPSELYDHIQADRRAGLIPWVVVANAGATNTGTVDRLSEIAAITHLEKLWFHVDAAYGWPIVLTDDGQGIMTGISEADSITFDGHKWFGQTIDLGGLILRNGAFLEETFSMQADYLQDVAVVGDQVNYSDRGLALTRRFRAFKMWYTMQVLGLRWHRELVERCCRLADYAHLRIDSTPEMEILLARQLSIVCFRCVPAALRNDPAALDALNAAIPTRLRESGVGLISSTRLNGRVVLRMCFVNWRTTAADIDAIIETIRSVI